MYLSDPFYKILCIYQTLEQSAYKTLWDIGYQDPMGHGWVSPKIQDPSLLPDSLCLLIH